jgi:hypothetical protein
LFLLFVLLKFCFFFLFSGVAAEAERVGSGLSDAGARERLKKLAQQLDPILEELHAAAAKANRNPNATDAFRDFVKLNHRLGDLTRQLIQEVVLPVGEIQALADRIVRGLDNQLNAIPQGKEGPVAAENKNLDDATDRLAGAILVFLWRKKKLFLFVKIWRSLLQSIRGTTLRSIAFARREKVFVTISPNTPLAP